MRNGPTFSLPLLDRLGARLEADTAAGAIPGADLLIGGTGGEIWRRTVGFRDSVAGDSLKPDAVWRIYSMTKVVVSVATLVLAEQGDLRLDQPVADFIPAFAHLARLGPGGTRVPAAAAPTIQDLLRHTAGIAYGYLGDGPTRRAYEADGLLTRGSRQRRLRRADRAPAAGARARHGLALLATPPTCSAACSRWPADADLQRVLDDDAPRAARHGRDPLPDPGRDGGSRGAAAAAGARAAAGLPRSERCPGVASAATAASSRPWRTMPRFLRMMLNGGSLAGRARPRAGDRARS